MPNTLYAIRAARELARDHPPGRAPGVDLDKVWTKPLLGHAISRVYHTPDQTAYDHLAPTHQVRFRTEREAMQAGYRPSKAARYGEESGSARTTQPIRARGLAAAIERLRRSLEPEESQAHGDLHVRLRDEEREREQDRGMSW